MRRRSSRNFTRGGAYVARAEVTGEARVVFRTRAAGGRAGVIDTLSSDSTITRHHVADPQRAGLIPAAQQEIEVPALASLPRAKLRAMLMAGAEVLECRRVLERAGINLVSDVLRGQGEFVEYEHYPRDDVYDSESRAQYYYHAHRAGEHGHFHTFLRVGTAKREDSPAGSGPDSGEPVHLIAISMDDYGWPIGLFATNHWVCGGAWLPAEKVIALLPRFRIDHAHPSWPVNRWIGAMMVLFRPHIEALLTHRDAVIDAWAKAHPERDVFEDRELEVTGYLPISVEETIGEVRTLAKRRSSI